MFKPFSNKSFLLLIIYSLITSCSSNPKLPSTTSYWLDINGNNIERETFLKIWRDENNPYSRLDYIKKDSGRVARLRNNLYKTYQGNYEVLSTTLSEITKKEYDKKTVFLIEYEYLGDLCTSQYRINNYPKRRIIRNKEFFKKQKQTLHEENPNLEIIKLFEGGINLELPNATGNYHFIDKNNYFRNRIFKDQTLCGSFALIKPNGNILVRNGEYTMNKMSRFLNKEIWTIFFPSELKESN